MSGKASPDEISQLHVWLAVYEDGSEGIMAGVDGIGIATLGSTNREYAEAMQKLAEAMQRGATELGKTILSVRLVTYSYTDGDGEPAKKPDDKPAKKPRSRPGSK